MSKLQLSALGLEDYYLVKNPLSSFLKPEYERHQKFSTQHVEILPNNTINFSQENNGRYVIKIPKEGHFLHNLTLHVEVPALTPTSGTYACWTNAFMYALIEKAEIMIGGKVIDTIEGIQMDISDELTVRDLAGKALMTGKEDSSYGIEDNALIPRTFNLPFSFWFNKDIRNSLPISVIYAQDIELVIYVRPFSECILYDGSTPPADVDISKVYLIGEYLNIERKYMKEFVSYGELESGLNYLIEQNSNIKTENIKANSVNFNTDLSFNHPIKEIIWVMVEDDSVDNNDHFNYSRRSDNGSPMTEAKFIHDGFDANKNSLPESYFRLVGPRMYHTNIPRKYINVYSFAQKPEELDPSGSLNVSALSSFKLDLKLTSGNQDSRLHVYGINYNILTIKNGTVNVKYI